jgi:hypothetical protein
MIRVSINYIDLIENIHFNNEQHPSFDDFDHYAFTLDILLIILQVYPNFKEISNFC